MHQADQAGPRAAVSAGHWIDPLTRSTCAGYVWFGQWLAAPALAALAEQRLASLVAYARANSPWYQAHYRGLPAAAARCTLPPTDKPTLMAHFDRVVTDRTLRHADLERFVAQPAAVGTPYDGRYAVWASSGTSGVPGLFVHDAAAMATYEALELQRFRQLALPWDALAHGWHSERIAMVAATGGHFAGVAMAEHLRRTLPWLAAQMQVFSLLQPWPQLLAQLRRFGPTIITTYPTAAELLAQAQEAGALDLRLTALWTGGETLLAGTRDRLARTFGCQVRNAYGASEFLSLAWDCGRALHLNADWACLEPVDAHGHAVAPGTASHTVLLTNLANRVQPLIRYDLGDSITLLAQPCACGSALPAIQVEGRHDDILVLPGRAGAPLKLLPLVLATVLEERAGVTDFQLVQTGRSALRLALGAGARDRGAAAGAALRLYLRQMGAARVTVSLADRPPERSRVSGKLRRVINRWRPA